MTFNWGTVIDNDPLRVRLDGDTATIPTTPDSLVDPSTIRKGARVRCELDERRLIVHGVAQQLEVPTSTVLPFLSSVVPEGWVLCDGREITRWDSWYLFQALNVRVGDPTISIASPGLLTLNGHNMQTGQMVYLTTDDTLPGGLAENVAYYVIRVSANTFRLATTLGNALAGTAIATTGTQAGTHTIRTTYGVGDGSDTFNVPDLRGRSLVGIDPNQAEFSAVGFTGGEKAHVLSVAEMPSHTHRKGPAVMTWASTGNNGYWANSGTPNLIGTLVEADSYPTGGGGAHNNLQPYLALNFIIKT